MQGLDLGGLQTWSNPRAKGTRNPGVWGWAVLGGSWVVISGVISRATIIIAPIRGLITPLLTSQLRDLKFTITPDKTF